MRFGLIVLPLLLAGCSIAPRAESGWRMLIALDATAKLGGCVAGDFLPEQPGEEIAVVASNGAVFMLRRVGTGWMRELVCQLPGEMIQVAAGDLDPDSPGDELVCVGASEGGEDDGGPGAVIYAWRQAGLWKHEKILEDARLVHGVAIGDVDPAREGLEVLVTGYTHKAHLLGRGESGWSKLGEVDIGAEGKGVAVGLGGAVCVNADGSMVEVVKQQGGWARRELGRFPHPLARVTANPREVVFCGNGGVLRRYSMGETRELFRAEDRLRGAVIADVDPNAAGPEICTASYTGEIVVIAGGVDKVVGRDDDKIHHLCVADLPALGKCLVACGYSGRVLVFQRR